jgi:dolichol-phosphate mannosyltransferase
MKLLVVVPTYNEIDNIGQFIGGVFSYAPEFTDIAVIDDSSPDGTGELVEKLKSEFPNRLHLITRQGKSGCASAYLHGFSWGMENGYDAVLAMDADFSHDPQFIPLLVEKIAAFDVVIGSRSVKGGRIENRSWWRNMLTSCAGIYCRFLLGCPIRDFTGGFNLWSRKSLELIGPDSVVTRGYSFQIEMKYKAYKAGCSMTEVPVIFPDRKRGVSKMSGDIFFNALTDVLKIRKMA